MAIEGVASVSALPIIMKDSKDAANSGKSTGLPLKGGKSAQVEGSTSQPSPYSPPKVSEEIIEKISKALDLSRVGREYRVYDKLGKVYIRVYYKDSGELIREIPPEQIIEMAKKMQELAGLILDQTI